MVTKPRFHTATLHILLQRTKNNLPSQKKMMNIFMQKYIFTHRCIGIYSCIYICNIMIISRAYAQNVHVAVGPPVGRLQSLRVVYSPMAVQPAVLPSVNLVRLFLMAIISAWIPDACLAIWAFVLFMCPCAMFAT